MNDDKTRYLLICNTADGLVAQLNGVVVQIQMARRVGLEPIVYLPGRSYMFGGQNPYFEKSHGENVWDYYFEPIGYSETRLSELVREKRVLTLSTASELLRLFRWEPRSWFMNPFGYFRSVENRADGAYPTDWWQAEREKARVFLKDGTIRFRASLERQVEGFVEKNFAKHTLGLQLRGSDKFDFGVGPNLSRKVVPEEYFPHIDRYLLDHPECERIFVATDQRQWLKILQEAYPGKIISFSEWSLSESDDNLFHASHAKAVRGAEVLVDLLLLSRCSYIFKCHAAVGEMALVRNSKIEFLDLNYVDQPFRAESRLARVLLAPSIQILCLIWRWLAESGLLLEKVTSVEDGGVRVEGGRQLYTKVEANSQAPRPPLLSRRFVSDAFDWALRALSDRCFAYEKRVD